jgi:hypothetical protein
MARTSVAMPAGVREELVVPVRWRPREYQLGLWNAIISGEKKRAACVWHRRAGKDHEAINIIAVSMFKRPGVYWHVLPTYAQGNKAIWNGMDNDGRRFIEYIPKQAVARHRNDEMRLEIYDELGGAQYQVIGGDNPDRIVGGNPVGVVFSEYSLMNPLGWDLVRPILNANGGWAIFIYTPRGHNHGYKMLQQARESELWYSEVLDITQTKKHDGTPVVTEAMVEEEIRAGMPEELARQEYYCDFSAPLVGAYYGKEFDKIDKEGRCSPDWKWRKDYPVNTCWDLGIRDTMAIWFYQVVDGWVHWIDYESGVGAGIEEYVRVLERKPYVYKRHYAPHDVNKRELGTGTSVMETAARLGLRFTLVPRTRSLDDDINAVRLVLARSRFDSEACGEGVEALRQYRKEFDYKNKVWSMRPAHDWTSHSADAIRTGCVVMPREAYTVKEPARFPTTMTFDEALKEHDKVVAESGKTDFKRL